DRIVVCLARDKDHDGFAHALAHLRDRVVWVGLPASHLAFGRRPPWAGHESAVSDLSKLLTSGNVLAVGTALFVGEVLTVLGVPTESLFDVPGRTPASGGS
ncbi:MAG: hypothetical protein LBK72_03940, partial [Bifidobacteriaceae bacterium]|nr:hypothetical protein [Bifidobacteriaceae bacterium]